MQMSEITSANWDLFRSISILASDQHRPTDSAKENPEGEPETFEAPIARA
jgi:hypothetical protein